MIENKDVILPEEENTRLGEALMLLLDLGQEKEITEEEMFRQEQSAEHLRAGADGQMFEILARIYRKLMLRRREKGGMVSLAIARTLNQVELFLRQEICLRRPEMMSYLDTVRCCMELQVSHMLCGAVNERNQKEIRGIIREYGQKILDGRERPETEEMIRLLDVLILAYVQEREPWALQRAEEFCMMRLEEGSVYREDDPDPEHLDVLANGYVIYGNVLRELKKREDAIWMMEMGCVLHKKASDIEPRFVTELLEDYIRLADTIAENKKERFKALVIERRAMMLTARIPDRQKDARFLEAECRMYTNAALLLAEGGADERGKHTIYAEKAVKAGERLMEIHPAESSYALLMKAMYIAGSGRRDAGVSEAYYRERAELYLRYASHGEESYSS